MATLFVTFLILVWSCSLACESFEIFRDAPRPAQATVPSGDDDECGEYLSAVASLPDCNSTALNFGTRLNCATSKMSTWCGRRLKFADYVSTSCAFANASEAVYCRAAFIPVGMSRVLFTHWNTARNASCNSLCSFLQRSNRPGGIVMGASRSHHCHCAVPTDDLPSYIGYFRYQFFNFAYSVVNMVHRIDVKDMSSVEIIAVTESKVKDIMGFDGDRLTLATPFILLAIALVVTAGSELPFHVRVGGGFVMCAVSLWFESGILLLVTIGLCGQLLITRTASAPERTFVALVLMYIIGLCSAFVFDSIVTSSLFIIGTIGAAFYWTITLYRAPRSVDLSVVTFALFMGAVTMVFMESYASSLENDSFVGFIHFLGLGMIPYDAKSYAYLGVANAAGATSDFMVAFRKMGGSIPQWFMIPLFFLRYSLIIVPRVLVGMVHFRKAGGLTLFAKVRRGAKMYVLDLFAPVRFATGIWTLDFHKTLLAFVVMFLSAFECRYCFELFVLHMIIGMVLNVGRSEDAKRLYSLVTDFHLCSDKFPVDGSLPDYDVNLLVALSRAVHTIKVKKSDCVMIGSSFFGKLVGIEGPTSLLSVFHVTRDHVSLQVTSHFNQVYDVVVEKFNCIGKCEDPVTAGIVQSEPCHNGVPITLLSQHEVKRVSFLTIMFPKSAVNFIKSFRFLSNGRIDVTCNFQSGDSGSPCFAVLNDGQIRLAGAVAAGTHSTDQPNIVSCVIGERKVFEAEESAPGLGHPSRAAPPPLTTAEALGDALKPDYGKGKLLYERSGLTATDKVDESTFVDEEGYMISKPTAIHVPDGDGPAYCRRLMNTLSGLVDSYNAIVKAYKPVRANLRIYTYKPFKDISGQIERTLAGDDAVGALSARFRNEFRDSTRAARLLDFQYLEMDGGVQARLRGTGSAVEH